MPAELEYLYCPLCASESGFETPPCPDGHGDECPERVCTDCSVVVSISLIPMASAA